MVRLTDSRLVFAHRGRGALLLGVPALLDRLADGQLGRSRLGLGAADVVAVLLQDRRELLIHPAVPDAPVVTLRSATTSA